MSQRPVVTKLKARANARADRARKTQILAESVGLTGWHRDDACTAQQGALKLRVVKTGTPRGPTYGPWIMLASITGLVGQRVDLCREATPRAPNRVVLRVFGRICSSHQPL